jgi:hypothetical protein
MTDRDYVSCVKARLQRLHLHPGDAAASRGRSVVIPGEVADEPFSVVG